jgi:glycosyltransferase involved in cell wall biosynthesis
LGIGPDDLVVAYVGRLAPEKGIDRLLSAWEIVAALHPTAHLVFTGAGLMEPAILARGLPRVHLTGVQRGLDLSAAYASADVFAMPSTTETFGNVTLEAMASGVPPVAVADGGVLDFGVHDENAWLTPPDRPDQLAAGIDRLLADPGLRRRLGQGARATALARGWGPVFDQLVDHYRSAVLPESGAEAA